MKKKLLSILLIGVLIVSLTGCGTSKKANNNNKTNSESSKVDNSPKEQHILTCGGVLKKNNASLYRDYIYKFDIDNNKVVSMQMKYTFDFSSQEYYQKAINSDMESIKVCESYPDIYSNCDIEKNEKENKIIINEKKKKEDENIRKELKADLTKDELKDVFEEEGNKNKEKGTGYQNVVCTYK